MIGSRKRSSNDQPRAPSCSRDTRRIGTFSLAGDAQVQLSRRLSDMRLRSQLHTKGQGTSNWCKKSGRASPARHGLKVPYKSKTKFSTDPPLRQRLDHADKQADTKTERESQHSSYRCC